MHRYSKGARAERELLEILKGKGYMVVRAAGSGVNSISPDLIAVKNGKVYAFECKFWDRNNLSLEKDKILYLKEIQKQGVISFVAWKIPRLGWFLIEPKEFKEQKKNYSISKDRVLQINRNLEILF
jgi:Holliday junction resolvase